MAEVKAVDALAKLIEAYGVGVRAGVLTPCIEDENEFRKQFGLAEASDAVKADWKASNGVRHPITTAKPEDMAQKPAAQPEGQPNE